MKTVSDFFNLGAAGGSGEFSARRLVDAGHRRLPLGTGKPEVVGASTDMVDRHSKVGPPHA